MTQRGAPQGAPPSRVRIMSWRLHDDVSFCYVDGHLIFLDIRKDRYFRLSDSLERTFRSYLAEESLAEGEIDGLIRRKILTNAPAATDRAPTPSLTTPVRSAIENGKPETRVSIHSLMETAAIVASMQIQLKVRKLKQLLSRLVEYRRINAPPPLYSQIPDSERRLKDASAAFMRARLYVPVEMCCLLDSVSMVRFLARRGLNAHIVFGVACDPFSAHSWVQAGNLVLNDTVGHATAHTPIRVV